MFVVRAVSGKEQGLLLAAAATTEPVEDPWCSRPELRGHKDEWRWPSRMRRPAYRVTTSLNLGCGAPRCGLGIMAAAIDS